MELVLFIVLTVISTKAWNSYTKTTATPTTGGYVQYIIWEIKDMWNKQKP